MNSTTGQARTAAAAQTGWREAPQALTPGAVIHGPLYAEVKRRVLASLMNGEWPAGAAIPPEAQLARSYGVSIGTVRKALGELVAERLLVRRPGRGTFPARHDRDHMLEAFYNVVDAQGHKELPASELVAFRRTAADDAIATRLELKRGASLIEYEHVLRLQDEPVIYDRVAVPRAMFPQLDESLLRNRDMTIFGLYQTRCGVTVTRLEEWVRATAAPPGAARHLKVKRGTPVLAIERVAQTYDGTPVEYRERYVDTSTHAYLNVLGMDRK